ncbi:hypothetical protein G6F62_010033 [Rhizopus arrhizus]|nr:hypothetical protein G6F62_010033 [Rhizopus arrhizus]
MTPHSQPTRCGYATLKRPPKPFEMMVVGNQEVKPERTFHPRKRPRVEESEQKKNSSIQNTMKNNDKILSESSTADNTLCSPETVYYDASECFDSSDDMLLDTLQSVFGISEWIPNQYESITSALANQDILIILPSGQPRHLCYQLPALLQPSLTLVMMPRLVYVEHSSIPTLFFLDQSSDMAQTVSARDLSSKTEKDIRLIYMTYSHFLQHRSVFQSIRHRVGRLVLDDAHCLSQWHPLGHPRYVKAVEHLKEDFPKIPITALTAIANERVQMDLVSFLGIHKIYKKSILF